MATSDSREIWFHSVTTPAGLMITTSMPNWATSTRRLSLNPSRAFLVAWYHAPNGS